MSKDDAAEFVKDARKLVESDEKRFPDIADYAFVLEAKLTQALALIDELQKQVAGLKEKFKRYGKHDKDCPFYETTTRACACGLE